jgi:hypothetical protein
MYKIWLLLLAGITFSQCHQSKDSLPEIVQEVNYMDWESEALKVEVERLIQSDNQVLETWGLYFKSRAYVAQGTSLQALPLLERAELLFRDEGDALGISKVLLLKAHAYWSLGAGEEILATAEECMSYREGNPMSWATAAGNYTTYLLDFGYYEKTLYYSDTVLSIFRAANGKINPSEAYAVRAEALYQLGRDPEAVDTLMKGALNLITEDIPIVDKQNIYFRALRLNNMSQEDLSRCILFASENSFWQLEAEARAQFNDYRLLGESKEEAIAAEIEANKMALVEVNQGQSRFLAFELERGAREMERFEDSARLRQNVLIISIVFAVLVALGIFFSYRNRLAANEAKLGKQEAELELATYRNKIRPHFLFNQLNNVSGLINAERYNDAVEYTAELGLYLRGLLGGSAEAMITLMKELKHLEGYVHLQQQSSFEHVAFSIETVGACKRALIPSGLLQPLIENSFKYAGGSRVEGAFVRVLAERNENELVIKILDSGYGSSTRKGGTGQGLALVKSRIAYYQKRNQSKGKWEVLAKFGKEKSTVTITVPFLQNESA